MSLGMILRGVLFASMVQVAVNATANELVPVTAVVTYEYDSFKKSATRDAALAEPKTLPSNVELHANGKAAHAYGGFR